MFLQHPDQLPASQLGGAQRRGEAQVGREHHHGQAQGRGGVVSNQFSDRIGILFICDDNICKCSKLVYKSFPHMGEKYINTL